MFFKKKPKIVQVNSGDEIILFIDRLAGEDAISLLDAVQGQFPASVIHLLVGFGRVEIVGKVNTPYDAQSTDQCRKEPVSRLAQTFERSILHSPNLGAKRNIVKLSYASGCRIVALSIPPEKQCNAINEPIQL